MNTTKIVKSALFLAIIYVTTLLIVIPIPGGNGYINISDALIMLVSTIFTFPFNFLISGISTMLADLTLGYPSYAIFTLFIKGFESIIVTTTLKKTNKTLIAFCLGGLFMVLAYGLTDVLLTSSLYAFVPAIIANTPQAIACIIIAQLVYKPFQKIISKKD